MGRYAVMADGESPGYPHNPTWGGFTVDNVSFHADQRPASLQQAPDMVSVCFPILDLN